MAVIGLLNASNCFLSSLLQLNIFAFLAICTPKRLLAVVDDCSIAAAAKKKKCQCERDRAFLRSVSPSVKTVDCHTGRLHRGLTMETNTQTQLAVVWRKNCLRWHFWLPQHSLLCTSLSLLSLWWCSNFHLLPRPPQLSRLGRRELSEQSKLPSNQNGSIIVSRDSASKLW